MPESFESMLAELAESAAAATAPPNPAAVRGRARQRTVRRRIAASALALTVLAACGGTVAAVAAKYAPRSGTAGQLAPAAGTPGPSGSGGSAPGSASAPGAASATSAASAAYTAIAGVWQLVDGDRYLIVFPDGVIGMGEAGAWTLCDGHLAPARAGGFAVSELACGDYGTTGLVLRSVAGGTELSLAVPARGAAAGYTVTYRSAGALMDTTSETAVLTKLLDGEWTSDNADKRDLVFIGGDAVSMTGVSGTGGLKYAGVVTAYYAGAVRVEIPCTSYAASGTDASIRATQKKTAAPAYCGVVLVQQDTAAQLAVVGSYGPEVLTRVGASTLAGDAASPSSSTADDPASPGASLTDAPSGTP